MPRLPPSKPEYGHYDKLKPERQRFVDEYLIDLNAAAAVLRAGYKNSGSGWQLLNRPEVQDAIKERRERVANDRNPAGSLFVLNKLWDVATADPRELIEVRRVPCRYCWGINGQYQFTKTEMDRLVKAFEFGAAKQPFNALWPTGAAERAAYIAGAHKLPFDQQGGDGYTTQRDPNPTCSECGSLGITLHYIADTRKLSPKARQLYRGVKLGKDKIEVLMADQNAAMAALAKHYGVATERREVWLRSIDPSKLTDDDLLRAVAEMEAITLEHNDFRTISVGRPQPDDSIRYGPSVPPDTLLKRRQASMARASASKNYHGQRGRRSELVKRPRTK